MFTICCIACVARRFKQSEQTKLQSREYEQRSRVEEPGRETKQSERADKAAKPSIGHSEIQQGTGASFKLQPIDKLTPLHERSR